MIVRYSESVEIDPELRFAIFAYAGKLEVYKRGMGMRATVKAIMEVVGTAWVDKLDELYPPGLYTPPKKRRPRQKASV